MRTQNLSQIICVESKSTYILLTDVINLKLGLINFVYFCLRHPVDLFPMSSCIATR